MRWIKRFAVLIIVVLVAFGAYAYFQISDYYPSTDDAYVHAHVVNIAPRVTGHIVALYVRDNQTVQRGQPLLKIDPRAYEYKLEQAEAELAQAERQRASIAAKIDSAQAQVQANQINYANAARNADRAKALAAKQYLSAQAADDAQTKAAELQAQLQANHASLAGAVSEKSLNKARIAAAEAAVRMAKLDLSETTIYAPITGVVSKVDKIHIGDVVSVNQDLFPLIGNQAYWIEANYKETDLDRVHPGLAATINIDMYPNHTFKGKVVSISGGAGNAFSLLPPENATGNWVKVTQRVPVRIDVLNPDPKLPLHIGTSATVTVTTKHVPGWVTFLQPYF
ncbi:HlyD family secretion protein [Acidithiobacillus sp. CV18-2]|uniref:HlyD family secretion protein n=1 Tax=Igneacidithiobacillus copahuensis TaxID=2724909 RepID=A0AAE2YMG8_9PROT|nr:HlyD family secretion protein [Igneacidithiobacillus copahuensis]MBU2755355.1 HlyD family secretion protein [Acidithiobacillus sp. CV18-3]MBU2757725.1 HlyD family secretion protein [Acidithiobacillus sp. BN09-2]MBU2777333.1 HlyD family secretion protein [Acidithiobacillus sp. CV18-2]MBU2797785.1 HlyD family secretion protein [Acidithiobacillus sp. VAN18-2]MBU2798546.1 HlyD family secretion protein [Acidithiobacillus sp. VAN18-4]UTV80571.1 HlyD family secretion protein [Acidithiobacillus sp